MTATIATLEELTTLLRANEGLVVLKCSSQTCEPCKRYARVYPGLCQANPAVTFAATDITTAQAIKEHFDITSLPTTIYMKGLKGDGAPNVLETIVGFNLPNIKASIARLQ